MSAEAVRRTRLIIAATSLDRSESRNGRGSFVSAVDEELATFVLMRQATHKKGEPRCPMPLP
jgi:hypothetical protein